jgi:hypothetical protein
MSLSRGHKDLTVEIGHDVINHTGAAVLRIISDQWPLITQRHGRIPPSRVADRDLGTTMVIWYRRLAGDRKSGRDHRSSGRS